MKRRETTIAAALLSTLIIAGSAANAQQGGKIPRIGLIWASTPLATWQASPVSQGFLKGLHDLGYEEGRNIIIEFRSAEGHWERLPQIADELVGLKVDVLVPRGKRRARSQSWSQPVTMIWSRPGSLRALRAQAVMSQGSPSCRRNWPPNG